jgi:hypothetical protein
MCIRVYLCVALFVRFKSMRIIERHEAATSPQASLSGVDWINRAQNEPLVKIVRVINLRFP